MKALKYENRKRLASAIEEIDKVLFEGLPANDECRCEEPDLYYKIHFGNLFNEIHAYCLKCGGIAETK